MKCVELTEDFSVPFSTINSATRYKRYLSGSNFIFMIWSLVMVFTTGGAPTISGLQVMIRGLFWFSLTMSQYDVKFDGLVNIMDEELSASQEM